MSVFRIYVEKRSEFAVEARGVLSAIVGELGIDAVSAVRMFNRYDVEGISEEDFALAKNTVFSEPPVDFTYEQLPQTDGTVLAIEYLPGQFDQRANSCAQCLQLVAQSELPTVVNARLYIIEGKITEQELALIKAYLINPVEAREASLELPTTLEMSYTAPDDVKTISGFCGFDDAQLTEFIADYGLAMETDDAICCRDYFACEKRDPTITEIRMIDTYWSDHCRHTTFATNIDSVEIAPEYIKNSYNRFLELREIIHAGKNRPVTLMDLATIGAKALRKNGDLNDLDISEEINACSVKIKVDHDGVDEDWLLMFKNETHNHPTEIEPFGGAATCLGGAIRDPLSGRSYVYQAMRLTGAGDPLANNSQTLKGKLPQRKIVTTAAAGYSSYGNQIGLATGHVTELYHPGYVAKRMEVGAVIGAAPADAVVREVPTPGDVIILLGGATGRDGCGGATGSSKSHTATSLETCRAEVQKGNAPEERKIQRLFRNPNVTRLIKRCNDFGAGGVAVAIGELADGLIINLDAVPKKYKGLDGTELAISESQERMAVVVAVENAQKFIEAAAGENLTATQVAVVTEQNRLVMEWNGKRIVDLSREFLNSNGAVKHTKINVTSNAGIKPRTFKTDSIPQKWLETMASLNVCSQKGLVQRFDSTVGGGTVLLPFGGATQLSPSQAMAAKLPVLDCKTSTCSLMAWGFNPYISQQSPYHGAMLAVVESIAKLVAAGANAGHCWLSFQEYFERLGTDSTKWGKPFAALLGALESQLELKAGAIGGKDSMSGSFEDLDVPPTLISFAVSTAKIDDIITTEFKKAGNFVYILKPDYDSDMLPCFHSMRSVFAQAQKLIAEKKAVSAWAVTIGGVCEGITKMTFGNKIGFEFANGMEESDLFAEENPGSGSIILECTEEISGLTLLGKTTAEYKILLGSFSIKGEDVQLVWEEKLHSVYPYNTKTQKITVPTYNYAAAGKTFASTKIARPKVLIPVFPGSNCEYDVARVFEAEGADPTIFVIRNRNASDIEQSVAEFAALVKNSNIVSIPGGFSGGDEPDGSGKFITAFFRNPRIKDAVTELLENGDGLVNGICNGFQALIKLGLVPYGKIMDIDESCPTLTFNEIGRHQTTMVHTRVASNKSPWLMCTEVGDVHTMALSHGEGRFICSPELIAELAEKGQIATQYVDIAGIPSMDVRTNPNGSHSAIEGITSPDGRVFGKMAHFERYSEGIYKNMAGEKYVPIFRGAVQYFTK